MNSQATPYFVDHTKNSQSPQSTPMSYEESSIKSQNLSNRENIKPHKTHTESRKQSFKNNSESEDDQSSEYTSEPLSTHTVTQSCVLFISHLPPCNIFPNQLFNIFSCFGEVLRVKIMSNDHSKALILFADASQATKALVMNGVQFRGETMQVRFSTTSYVDPVSINTCPSIRDLTEDYYGKIVHRFNSSEYTQIPWHMPSRKLHVVGFDGSNPNIKEILIQLFANCGSVVNITILKNMAWIEMDTIESATNAVALIHNTNLYTLPGKLLRVSYATYGNK